MNASWMTATLALAASEATATTGGDRFSSMMVFFFLGLLIVSPYAYFRLWPILREKRGHDGDLGDLGDGTDSAGRRPRRGRGRRDDASPPEPDDLATVVAAIGDAAGMPAVADATGVEVTVPANPTVDGRPAPPAVVDTLIADAVRRSGLVVASSTECDDGSRRIVVRRA